MSIKLEDYDAALRDIAPEIRDVLEGSFHEASRVMSPTGLEKYLEGAKALSNLGRGSGIVTTYLQEIPLAARDSPGRKRMRRARDRRLLDRRDETVINDIGRGH